MSLWNIAVEHANSNENAAEKSQESTIIFLGMKGSGKTSMIYRLLERTENPKPTVALEYFFGRRNRGHNMAKDVAHIWELGGGVWLTKLLESVISPDNVDSLSIVLVVDLSRPSEMWHTVETLLKATKARISYVMDKCREEGYRASVTHRAGRLSAAREAYHRVERHPEIDIISPFPVPLLIIGGKYDKFLELESSKKSMTCSALRFLNHYYGASLQFFSTQQETLVNRTRAMFSHLLFNTNEVKHVQLDKGQPLSVPCGMDSFENIGEPPVSNPYDMKAAKNPLSLWKAAFAEVIPQKQETSATAMISDPAKDPHYKEEQIDAARQRKDEELERYKRTSERHMRDLMQLATNEGILIV